MDPRLGFHLPLEVAYQRGYLNKDTHDQLSEPSEVRSYIDPSTDERLSYTQLLRRCRRDEASGLFLLPLSDARKHPAVEAAAADDLLGDLAGLVVEEHDVVRVPADGAGDVHLNSPS